jgi:release factor glutamine methyltransferase
MNVTEAVTNATKLIAANPQLAPNAKRDAELLLMHALNWRRETLIANSQQQLHPSKLAYYNLFIDQRQTGKPIQYITHKQQFWGLDLTVNESVLIPRPETEHLVEAALELLPHNQPTTIIDVGTGSGAIAIALAHDRPNAKIRATDISPEALATGRINAEHHQVAAQIEFIQSDLLAAIPDNSADMIVSNPPYVADSERESLAIEVRDYEPTTALFAGPTGFEIYQRLIPNAHRALKQKGWLLLEIGAGQHKKIQELLNQNHFTEIRFVNDLQQIPRVAVAQKALWS